MIASQRFPILLKVLQYAQGTEVCKASTPRTVKSLNPGCICKTVFTKVICRALRTFQNSKILSQHNSQTKHIHCFNNTVLHTFNYNSTFSFRNSYNILSDKFAVVRALHLFPEQVQFKVLLMENFYSLFHHVLTRSIPNFVHCHQKRPPVDAALIVGEVLYVAPQ